MHSAVWIRGIRNKNEDIDSVAWTIKQNSVVFSLSVQALINGVTVAHLKDHMKEAGEVVRVDIAYRHDGKSRGFAIVQFASAKSAAKAIKMFNETDLDGRTIMVREDDGSSQVSGKGGKGARRGGYGMNDAEPEDGYSHSGRTGRNGWVKPEGGDAFVDDGPPPEPKSMLR